MVHRRRFAGWRAHGSAGREGQDGREEALRTRYQPQAGGLCAGGVPIAQDSVSRRYEWRLESAGAGCAPSEGATSGGTDEAAPGYAAPATAQRPPRVPCSPIRPRQGPLLPYYARCRRTRARARSGASNRALLRASARTCSPKRLRQHGFDSRRLHFSMAGGPLEQADPA